MATSIDLPKFTLDFVNRLFIVKSGVTEIDVAVDMYSDWKEGILANNEGGQSLAMRAVGGDEIDATTGQSLGSTFFLLNGYKIRPQEASHSLTITGNLFSDPSTNALFVPTLGAFTVSIIFKVSNLVDASVARLDLDQVLQAIYIDTVGGSPGTTGSIGTPTNPVNNVADARTIADERNLRSYVIVRGQIMLDQDHTEWIFSSHDVGHTVDLNGFSVDGSTFNNVGLLGSGSGSIEGYSCLVGNLSGLNAEFETSRINGTITLPASGTLYLHNCADAIAGPGIPTVVFGATGGTLQLRSWNGGILVQGMTTANHECSFDLDPGRVVLDSSNTGGSIIVRGVGKMTDTLGNHIETGTYNGVDVTNETVTPFLVAKEMLDHPDGIEVGFTLRQALRLAVSALAGKISGAAGTTIIIRDVNDAKDRITATVDGDGNRVSLNYDVS